MSVILTLGPVLFSDFEIPESIPFGGSQQIVVHKLPGGSRVIDAMGRDDADIKWSGRFRGSSAETRARLMDFLRVQGQPLELTWSSFRYTVLISAFEADYSTPNEIPYSVTCLVVVDETSPLLNALLGLDAAIGANLNNVLQIANALNIPGVSTAVAGVQSATSSVQTFQGASSTTISAVQTAITTALTVVSTNITANNSVVQAGGSVAGAAAGLPASSLASNLSSQSNSFSALGQLYQLKASLGTMFTNVGNGAQ